MNEWTVVTVIAALVGLGVSLAKPLLHLNSTLTRLTDAVAMLEKEVSSISGRNSDEHNRLWAKERAQDAVLQDHEERIRSMETQ